MGLRLIWNRDIFLLDKFNFMQYNTYMKLREIKIMFIGLLLCLIFIGILMFLADKFFPYKQNLQYFDSGTSWPAISP